MTAKHDTERESQEPDEAELQEAEIVEEPPAPELSPEEQLQAERDEYLENWRRTQADIQNLRRRQGQVIDAAVKSARRELFSELLLVLDYLDMALLSPVETQEGKNLRMGVQMTRDQMLQFLSQHEIEAIHSEGAFDPELHEAVETVPTEDAEPGTIVSTLRAGYKAGSDVLRYAQVKVAAAPEAGGGAGEETDRGEG